MSTIILFEMLVKKGSQLQSVRFYKYQSLSKKVHNCKVFDFINTQVCNESFQLGQPTF